MRQAGSNNPVFLLDEIDKMSTDFRGDPSAALLEVLDPEQNNTFSDHYIECAFDLSNVMFVTTANSIYNIPQPLLDRMETIFIAGYTEEEKVKIAENFLVPKQVKENGLKNENLVISEATLRRIIRQYTREAGVRNLERQIAAICRKTARTTAKNRANKTRVTVQNLDKFIGIPRFRFGLAEKENEVGVATGLAWTESGGDTLAIEVTLMKGKGRLTLTGKLGDVMQESAQAAFSYIRSRSENFNLQQDFHEEKDIHIHIPEGAIPKDGPSAGITMATALVSALTDTPVRKDVAMTGEITLRGRVLPVGGIKEKVLSAHRAGIKKILMPGDNKKDTTEIPANVRRRVDIVFVDHMDQVLKEALEEKKEGGGRGKGKRKEQAKAPEGNAEQGKVPEGNEVQAKAPDRYEVQAKALKGSKQG
jgi:ATP-dependent Lon protease